MPSEVLLSSACMNHIFTGKDLTIKWRHLDFTGRDLYNLECQAEEQLEKLCSIVETIKVTFIQDQPIAPKVLNVQYILSNRRRFRDLGQNSQNKFHRYYLSSNSHDYLIGGVYIIVAHR